jgi:hypothetical protein
MRPAAAFVESEGASGGGICKTEKCKLRPVLLRFPNTLGGVAAGDGGSAPCNTNNKGLAA